MDKKIRISLELESEQEVNVIRQGLVAMISGELIRRVSVTAIDVEASDRDIALSWGIIARVTNELECWKETHGEGRGGWE